MGNYGIHSQNDNEQLVDRGMQQHKTKIVGDCFDGNGNELLATMKPDSPDIGPVAVEKQPLGEITNTGGSDAGSGGSGGNLKWNSSNSSLSSASDRKSTFYTELEPKVRVWGFGYMKKIHLLDFRP